VWQEFLDSRHSHLHQNAVTSFELYLKREFEEIIKREPPVLGPHAELGGIANITFAFDNHELIDLLKKRGAAKLTANEEKVKEFEAKIEALQKE